MSELYELPDGWKWKSLGEISDFKGGSQPPKKEFIYEKEEGYVRFLQIRDFSSDKNITYISIAKKNRLCEEDDILIGRYGASVGKILSGLSGAYNVAIMKTFPNKELITKRFFYMYLISPHFQTPLLNDLSQRAAQNGFSKDDITPLKVPLPPLSEQQRIVSKLNKLFEKIDKGVALHQKNMDEADLFMGSVLNDVFGELEEKYDLKSIGSFSKVGTGVTPLKSRNDFYDNGNINWITSKATNKDYVFESEQLITEIALDECRLKINPIGTIIVALYGQGKTRGQVSELIVESTTNQALATILVDKNQSINTYLKYFLKKSYLDIREKASGGTQPNLNLSIIKGVELPLPPLNIQQKAVKYLDKISEKIEKLKQVQKEKMESLIALKASILDKAFRGEL